MKENYMNDFQKIINKETEELNKTYYYQLEWEQEYGKGSLSEWSAEYVHCIIPFGMLSDSNEKSCICLVSDDNKDYVVGNKTYNKCMLYVPNYSIFEGEHTQFPSGLVNFVFSKKEHDFWEKFGNDIIKPLCCFGILETDSKDRLDFLYRTLKHHIEDTYMEVPGVWGKNFYMIDCKEIENWCHTTFYEMWKNYLNG